MGVFKKKKFAGSLSRAEALAAVPVKNTLITEQRMGNGELLLTYPSALRPWVAALLKRLGRPPVRPVPRKLQLDTLGSHVWSLLDGKCTVRQIVENLAQKYQLHPKEAEVSVTQFLRSLGQRGLIGMR
jgi:hypothetical protein